MHCPTRFTDAAISFLHAFSRRWTWPHACSCCACWRRPCCPPGSDMAGLRLLRACGPGPSAMETVAWNAKRPSGWTCSRARTSWLHAFWQLWRCPSSPQCALMALSWSRRSSRPCGSLLQLSCLPCVRPWTVQSFWRRRSRPPFFSWRAYSVRSFSQPSFLLTSSSRFFLSRLAWLRSSLLRSSLQQSSSSHLRCCPPGRACPLQARVYTRGPALACIAAPEQPGDVAGRWRLCIRPALAALVHAVSREVRMHASNGLCRQRLLRGEIARARHTNGGTATAVLLAQAQSARRCSGDALGRRCRRTGRCR